MKWIAVKDKLPPPDTKVLCLHAYGTDGPELMSLYWSRVQGWYSFEWSMPRSIHITYWCQMPSVPDDWSEWQYLEELLSP